MSTVQIDRQKLLGMKGAELVEFYNAHRPEGKPEVKRFATRGDALARIDRDVFGTWRGKTDAELREESREVHIHAAKIEIHAERVRVDGEEDEPEPVSAPAAIDAIVAAATSTPADPPWRKRGRRSAFRSARALPNPKRRLLPGAARARIYEYLMSRPKHTATLEEIESAVGLDPRGPLSKMAVDEAVELLS